MAGRKRNNANGANVGYEAELWHMADALRGSMAKGIFWVPPEACWSKLKAQAK